MAVTHYGSSIPTGATTVTSMSSATTPGGERVESTRKVSSVVVSEQWLGPRPQAEEVRYIEREVMEEQVKYVPRKEIVEVEKRVPKIEYEWVERVVEVPRTEIIEKMVDVPQYVDVPKYVPVVQVIDRPTEVIRHVPKIIRVPKEKVVEVPGEIIPVPKPYVVEQPVHVNRFKDVEVPLVVAQTVKPYIVEGAGTVTVDVNTYEPECVPIDVHVMKPLRLQVETAGVVDTIHRVVGVPAAQYNTMLKQLNGHLSHDDMQKLPYLTENGQVSFLGETVQYIAAPPNTVIHDRNAQPSLTSAVAGGTRYVSGAMGGSIMSGGEYMTTTQRVGDDMSWMATEKAKARASRSGASGNKYCC